MAEANEWLATYSKFWQVQLDAFDKYLSATAPGEENDEHDQSRSRGHGTSEKDR